LPLNILVDESIDSRITRKLKSHGFDLISVSEYFKGFPDIELIKLSRKLASVLLTEDRDFGEWVFAHQEKNVSVIFLRYRVQDIKEIIESLIKILSEKQEDLYGKFCVITINKIRIGDLYLLD